MTNPISEGVNTAETNDETYSLKKQELVDVIKAGSSEM